MLGNQNKQFLIKILLINQMCVDVGLWACVCVCACLRIEMNIYISVDLALPFIYTHIIARIECKIK